MTTYRVVWNPTVFVRWRDFDTRAEAQTYLAWALTADPTACIVTLDSTEEPS